MAYIHQEGGKWRAQVVKNGVRKSRTFVLKSAAVAWANQVEADIASGTGIIRHSLTVGDLLDRYAKEVSPTKKGARWEVVRLKAIGATRIAQVRLSRFDATHAARWRDERLQAVSAASVRREINLLSSAFTLAVREWKWIPANPFLMIRKPADAKPRTRVIRAEELALLLKAASSNSQRAVGRALCFALETGMRAGEICGLREGDIVGNVAILHDTKNGTPRHVPLSKRALEILAEQRGAAWKADTLGSGEYGHRKPLTSRVAQQVEQTGAPGRSGVRFAPRQTVGVAPHPLTLFGLTPATLDAHFREIRKRAGLEDIHFHDSRRTAATRLAKILNPYELSRMLGHKNLNMTLNTYYKDDPQQIAEKLK